MTKDATRFQWQLFWPEAAEQSLSPIASLRSTKG